MTHTLIAWMRDKPGVLNRVAGMLRRRNFNIDSLQVGHSETPGISRMTFVVNGNQHMVDQVIKQLRKIVDVTRVEDITEQQSIARWHSCGWPPTSRTARNHAAGGHLPRRDRGRHARLADRSDRGRRKIGWTR